jgi:hypothetical protein
MSRYVMRYERIRSFPAFPGVPLSDQMEMTSVALSQRSDAYIDNIFGRYHLSTAEPPQVWTPRTVLHYYAVADTMADEHEFDSGYEDALLVEVHAYHVPTQTKYVLQNYHDEVEMHCPVRMRIFKDGSTMLIFDVGIRINQSRGMIVIPAGEAWTGYDAHIDGVDPYQRKE